jgi:hypothetical protein
LRTLQEDLEFAGLAIDAPPGTPPLKRKKRLGLLLLATLLLPFATLGVALHAPTYQLIRYVAFRYSGELADVTATVKLVAGMLFFPLTWILAAGLAAHFSEQPQLWLTALAGPLLGWAAIRFNEVAGALRRSYSVVLKARRSGVDWDAIQAERAKITEEMARLLAEA